MPLVILQPCGRSDSKKNYANTIKKPVEINNIKSLLTQKEYSDLVGLYPDGDLMIWGVTPGSNEINVKKWEKIQPGDVTLFSAKGGVFSTAVVTHKTHNKNLATHIWGHDEKGATWEYIYFLEDLRIREIPYSELNPVIPYKDNKIIQGFSILDDQKSRNVLSAFDLESKTYFPPVDIEEVHKEIEEDDSLDRAIQSIGRKEQSALRYTLFRNRKTGICCICNKEYPLAFLVAAHIKTRSECTLSEKKDLNNIAAPMCKFGCDDLYENGYVGVENGYVKKIRNSISTSALDSYLEDLKNNRCSYWKEGTQRYFQWHMNKHQNSIVREF